MFNPKLAPCYGMLTFSFFVLCQKSIIWKLIIFQILMILTPKALWGIRNSAIDNVGSNLVFHCTPFKGKVWSKMKLDKLVVCVKDRQSAIFLKAKKDFLT